MTVLGVITQSRVWKRPWSCCIHCWDKYEVRDSAPHCWGKAGPVSGLLSQYFPQHIPPCAPLFPQDLLSAHFLSACYCTYSASLTSGPAISHRRVNCCWPGGLSQHKVSFVRCPLWGSHWLLECDKANGFHLAFVFTFVWVCAWVCACAHGVRWLVVP